MITNGVVSRRGPLEEEFIRRTGKTQMRIGRRLKKRFSGLNREQIAERLLKQNGFSPNVIAAATAPRFEKQLSVAHSFELRPGRVAKLEVPADLSAQETATLAKLIELLGPQN